ncbi:MAG: hypothetical protein U5K69_26755 [Balneolaceae bacterium]|nr:hypothetical protein [Balneolaceae bacterium]
MNEGGDLREIGDEAPFSLQANNPQTFETIYLNKTGIGYTEFRLDEIVEKWPENSSLARLPERWVCP